jgi:hypothetical protein
MLIFGLFLKLLGYRLSRRSTDTLKKFQKISKKKKEKEN